MVILEGQAFGRCLSHENGAYLSGMGHIKEAPERSQSLLTCEDLRSFGPGRGPSLNHVGLPNLGRLLDSRTVGNEDKTS